LRFRLEKFYLAEAIVGVPEKIINMPKDRGTISNNKRIYTIFLLTPTPIKNLNIVKSI